MNGGRAAGSDPATMAEAEEDEGDEEDETVGAVVVVEEEEEDEVGAALALLGPNRSGYM